MTDTSNDQPEPFDLKSDDVAARKRADFKRLFPEVFNEDKIDLDQLRRVLGDWVDEGSERFGLTWPGKAACMRVIQAPATGGLRPDRDESVNFDESENVFIEGDNLEVLKLLQKAYFGKIKMIYIDPPYNTGKEFIYPDKYAETLGTYLSYTGQRGDDGRRFSTNSEEDGRLHSNWINMMYPRLYLARNLLKDDGVIFVSIDDNEAANLRQLCDQVFGQENHLVTMYVQVRYPGKTLAEKNDYQKLIEQVLVYTKADFSPKKESEEYKIEKFCWHIDELEEGHVTSIGGRDVEIFKPGQYKITKVPPSTSALKETWATGSVLKVNASGKYFGKNLAPRKSQDGLKVLYKVKGIGEDGLGFRYFTGPQKESATKGKFFSGVPLKRLEQMKTGSARKEKPILNFHNFADAFGNCRHEGAIDFRGGKKPIEFLKTLIRQSLASDEQDIVLDFFAGSASTAHAVFDLNKEDGGNRKFIMVQLPEPVSEEDRQEHFNTISELSRERIRRAASKLAPHAEKGSPSNIDYGFRAFNLSPSSFTSWDAASDIAQDDLLAEIEGHASHTSESATDDDILFELLLKDGFELTTKVEQASVAGGKAYSVADGALLICLERNLTKDIIDALADLAEKEDAARVVCLDAGFQGNDQLKTNAVQTFKSRLGHGEDGSIFRTV
ncbi:site-specific DNA-methyltransferase [Qipengyuania sp. 1NDH17]|uniref:site-specific DNA-methyltransferase (adenine-specific) n=1 Tax=Qipengyuania polymorpha TaxID=2867234 RepID=A0ABS7J477_9SPHN|nr:site-specific DNA-methyltransferase [Qipengyuania polymorpha]MBX7459360.1 site-specific DNA-methyltransferase [Qipengyuania polymorpha]